jgi:hypothetical protein
MPFFGKMTGLEAQLLAILEIRIMVSKYSLLTQEMHKYDVG